MMQKNSIIYTFTPRRKLFLRFCYSSSITFAFPSIKRKAAAIEEQDKEQLVQSPILCYPSIISIFNKEFSCLKIRLVSISHVQQKTFWW